MRRIFTLCGGHISPILVGCKKIGIEVIDTRDEANAVFAADATARMTGVPGVAAVTAGPGVTNTVTALVNAHLAQSPLVLLGGAAATVLKGRGSLQDIDQRPLIAGAVKRCLAIKKTCDVVPVLENAFRIAKSGVPGPVFVECHRSSTRRKSCARCTGLVPLLRRRTCERAFSAGISTVMWTGCIRAN